MEEQITIFEVIRTILLWLSPALLLIGLCLILINEERYNKLEKTLGIEVGGIKKRLIPKLESNIYTLHDWLIKKRALVGLFLVVYSTVVFLALRK